MNGLVYSTEHGRGKRYLSLLNSRFNKNRTNNHIEKETKRLTLAASCERVRILIPGSYTGPIERPRLEVDAKVTDVVFGDFSEVMTSGHFEEGEEPRMKYQYELSDEQLIHLIDSGLYTNNRFEPVLNKLLKDEVFNTETDVDVHYLTVDDGVSQNGLALIRPIAPIKYTLETAENDFVSTFGATLAQASDRTLDIYEAQEIDNFLYGDNSLESMDTEDVETYKSIDLGDRILDLDDTSEDVVVPTIEDDVLDDIDEIEMDDVIRFDNSGEGVQQISEDELIRQIKEREREEAYILGQAHSANEDEINDMLDLDNEDDLEL